MLRTVSLPKEEFDKQTGGGLWRISITARAGGPGAPSYSPVSSQDEATAAPGAAASPPRGAVAVDLPTSPLSPGGSVRPDPPRSILGLPVISCQNSAYLWWVLAILLLDLVYSAFLLPLSIGFQVPDLEWSSWACWMDLIAGAFLAVELLLGFHVSYFASHSGHQREVKGGRAVARYYMRHGSFWQDAMCAAGWVTQIVLLLVRHAGGVELGSSSSAAQYVRIVRMVRFLSVLRQMLSLSVGTGMDGQHAIIPVLRVPPRLAHVLNVAYSTCVLVHFFACLWNFIAIKQGLEHTWLNTIPAFQRRYSADGASPLTAEELAAVHGSDRYVAGLYFTIVTVATLGYGDVVPVNTAEYLVDCAVIATGVLMFGLAMGSLAEMVATGSKEARQAQLFRDKIEHVNAWLHNSSIPRPLKHRIRQYYAGVWLQHAASKANAAEQFLELPHALQLEVAWELNRKLLMRLPLFRELDDAHQQMLSSMLLPVELTPGQELCLHGDLADSFWLLHAGEVQVLDECSVVVSVVSAPAVLGAEALLQHVDATCATRPWGLQISTACTIWEAPLEDLMPWLLDNVRVLDALSCRAQQEREALQDRVGRQRLAEAAVAAQATLAGLHQAGVGSAFNAQQDPQQLSAAAATDTSGGQQAAERQLPAAGADTPSPCSSSSFSSPGLSSLAQEAHIEGCGSCQDLSSGAVAPPGMAAVAEAEGAGHADVPATKGEVQRLQRAMVRRLDALQAAISAGGMAQLVARLGSSRSVHRTSSRLEAGAAESRVRRRHWSYGQLTTL